MNGEKIYHWLTTRGDLDASFNAMANAELRDLNIYLDHLPIHGGIPLLIKSRLDAEAADRFINAIPPTET